MTKKQTEVIKGSKLRDVDDVAKQHKMTASQLVWKAVKNELSDEVIDKLENRKKK